MSGPAVATRPKGSSLFRETEPVFPGVTGSPKFGDHVWNFRSVIVRTSQSERAFPFYRIPEAYRLAGRELLMILAQPNHPAVVAAGIVVAGGPRSTSSLIDIGSNVGMIGQWGIARGLHSLSDWTQQDADMLLLALRDGSYRDEGVPLSPSRIRQWVTILKSFREFGPALTGGGLTFMPWGAITAAKVAGDRKVYENATRPMPWEQWAPLVAAAWTIVSQFSVDIVPAWRTYLELPAAGKGKSGKGGWAALQAWVAAGNKVPLHTGFGRTGPGVRGEVNVASLCRLANVNPTFVKSTNHQFVPGARETIARWAEDPAIGAFGGLYEPTVLVTHPDGNQSTWVSEIGIGEVEYLISVLRGACYIILASLTGMRDSELQELQRGCVTEADGLPALQATQIKGNTSPIGEDRSWWAPQPVLDTIAVLEQISPHPTHLFARSGDPIPGTYDPIRDVRRVVEFVNAEPDERAGRGSGLGLQRIDMSSGVPVNQQTLRRSYSVLSAQRPGAELGLGIQLGHAALRMTTGYMTDSRQSAVQLFNDERRNIARQQAETLIRSSTPVAGKRDHELLDLRAQLLTDPQRADAIINSVADRYHIGTFNDCMFSAERAACGPTGPHLASQHCATTDCQNATFLTRHEPVVRAQIERLDDWLNRGTGHPAIVTQMREERAKLAAILRTLNTDTLDEEEPA